MNEAPSSTKMSLQQKRRWIIVEAWQEDREINKRILADAIKVLLIISCALAVGYAGHLIPGATAERIKIFDAYHFYSVLAISVYFTLLLVAEVTVVFVRRLRKLSADHV